MPRNLTNCFQVVWEQDYTCMYTCMYAHSVSHYIVSCSEDEA